MFGGLRGQDLLLSCGQRAHLKARLNKAPLIMLKTIEGKKVQKAEVHVSFQPLCAEQATSLCALDVVIHVEA